jgi:hypothetical protein
VYGPRLHPGGSVEGDAVQEERGVVSPITVIPREGT